MVEKEAWYIEADERELQRQFRNLPQGEEGIEQSIKLFLRTGQFPDEETVKQAFWHLTDTWRMQGLREDQQEALWKLLVKYPGYLPDKTRDDNLELYALKEMLYQTPRELQPKFEVEFPREQRTLDFSVTTPPGVWDPWSEDDFHPEVIDRDRWVDEAVRVYHDTDWEETSSETRTVSAQHILQSMPGAGRTMWFYYLERPSFLNVLRQAEELLKAGDQPLVSQERIGMDIEEIDPRWRWVLFRWKVMEEF